MDTHRLEDAPETTTTSVVSTKVAAVIVGVAMAVGLGLGIAIGATAFVSDGNDDGAVASANVEDVAESPFQRAKDACAGESSYVRVLDAGTALEVNSEGEEKPGASWTEVFCVLDELAVPEAVMSRIDSTRALDGTLDAEWDGVFASWTYHPDNGLWIVFEER